MLILDMLTYMLGLRDPSAALHMPACACHPSWTTSKASHTHASGAATCGAMQSRNSTASPAEYERSSSSPAAAARGDPLCRL